MKNSIKIWSPGLIVLTLLSMPAWGKEFFVSPQGELPSLEAAIQTVAQFRESHPDYSQPVIVTIEPGVYFLENTPVLNEKVAGNVQSPTVFQAREGSEVVFSGGILLRDWKVNEKGWWEKSLTEADWNLVYDSYQSSDRTIPEIARHGEKDNPFTQLFVNNQRRYRPRLPKKGYFHIQEQLPPTDFVEGEMKPDNCFRFGVTDGLDDIRNDFSNRDQIEILATHHWNASRLPIADVDSEKKIVVTRGRVCTTSYWGRFMKDHPYFLDNVADALSEPGEWYYNPQTKILTYIPLDGETPENTEVILPRLQYLLKLENTQYIQFKGITFAHGAWVFPQDGMHYAQAESGLFANVIFRKSSHCHLENCRIRHCGAYALKLEPESTHNTLSQCDIFDIGGGGIFICGDHNTITDSTLAHLGRLHPAAIGIFIQRASYNTVTHCDIYDLYYSSVSVGWSWGYQPSSAHHNVIAWNHMHTIGQGLLSDMGGVYTLGISPGTRIEYNRIHDVLSFGYGGWGLYTDEGSTGIIMRGNTVFRTKSASFHQHYGKENIIENNILVNGLDQQLQRTRTEEHLSFFFRKNIVYWNNPSPLFGSNWKDNHFQFDNNLYYNPHKKAEFPDGLEKWQKERRQDVHSLIDTDPMFVDIANDDYRLKPESPAWKLGFQELPTDQTPGRQTSSRVSRYPSVPAAFTNPRVPQN